MKLSEINANILYIFENFTNEDGELSDGAFEQIESLQMEESEKIESLALLVQTLKGEAQLIKDKVKSMQDRAKSKENRAESIKGFLSNYLQAQNRLKFETPYVAISFRKSTRCEIGDEQKIIDFATKHMDMGLVKTTVEVSKTAVTNAIKGGLEIPGAVLVESQNIQLR